MVTKESIQGDIKDILNMDVKNNFALLRLLRIPKTVDGIAFLFALYLLSFSFIPQNRCYAKGASPEVLISRKIKSANALIQEAVSKKDYDKYIEAAKLLREADKHSKHISDVEKKAYIALAIAYCYGEMKNEYTKSFFDTDMWIERNNTESNDKTKEKRESWKSIEESYRFLDIAIENASKLPNTTDSHKVVVLFLVAIGYDRLRVDAPVNETKYSKDSLHKKAVRYLKRAFDSGCTISGWQEMYVAYEKADAWKTPQLFKKHQFFDELLSGITHINRNDICATLKIDS